MADQVAEPEPYLSPEQEVLELASTVDPSYIIQLIRQLLPSLQKGERQWPSETVHNESQEMDRKSLDKVQSLEKIIDVKQKRLSEDKGIGEDTTIKTVFDQTDHSDVGVRSKIEGSQSLSSEIGDRNTAPAESSSPKECVPEIIGSKVVSSISEEQREEAGCMLWDLAATQSHAEFMVKNHILDVILAILSVPHSDRIREICIGIMGNLACHAIPVKAIIHMSGLPSTIVQNLFVDDAPSLSEVCRLLSASLHSEEIDSWLKITNSKEVLERVLWIASNTMNSLLLEKSTELLLAMVDCQGSMASSLISNLVELGLLSVITDILVSEISAFDEGTCQHGNVVLDTVLQIAEALSLADDVARQLADNVQLFSLACQVIRLSAKDEIGPAGISAAVLLANLLAENEELIHRVLFDEVLIKQFLELLPSAGDDPGARNALWSILNRFSSAHSVGQGKDASGTIAVTLVFARGSDILIEDLLDHRDAEEPEEADGTRGLSSKIQTVRSFLQIMEDSLNACDTRTQIDDEHETIKNACCLLRGGLRNIKQGMYHKQGKSKYYQNGSINHDK